MKVWLHYIGDRYYSKSEFIREASKYFAQRAVPFTVLKGMKSGDIIYYAKYNKQLGIAEVFAKGRIIGFSTTYDVAKKLRLKEELDIIEIRRECGYILCNRIVTDKTVEELINDLCMVENEHVLRAHKWFILTDIMPYDSVIQYIIYYKVNKALKRVIVQHDKIKFTRGYILLGANKTNINVKDEDKYYMQISRYSEKTKGLFRYKEPKEKPKTDTIKRLDEWLGGDIA
jgi:hypothetical protein